MAINQLNLNEINIVKAKIYVTQQDNDKFFGQKLPTWRNGFCYIERSVELCTDPNGIYDPTEYGTIKIGNRRAIVTGEVSGMELLMWAEPADAPVSPSDAKHHSASCEQETQDASETALKP